MLEKQKVLVVDDNPNNIKLVINTLKNLDISIVFATSGFKALDIINEQSIDLILMDINMPQMNGFETVKKIDQNIPVIFVTALDDKDSIVEAFTNGGVDYITKPFYPEELIARVTTHLNLSKLNNNLIAQVEEKSKELQQSMFIDHSTGAFNASQLYIDLLKHDKTTAAMIHLKKMKQFEIVYGLDNIENFLSKFVNWVHEQSELKVKLYHITYSDFICLFDTNDSSKIEEWCKTILEKLENKSFDIDEKKEIHIHSTITVASGEGKELIQYLRVAQIEAKNKNLNYYFYNFDNMDIIKQQEKNLYWMKFLKQSFKNDTLVPFFQPIVDTQTSKINKYECLARIKDKDEIISPFFFIPAAQQLGMITQITKTMIKKSCQTFANTNMQFSVNITKDDLTEGYLSDMLNDMVQTYKLSKEQITLEVLEEISVFGSNNVIEGLLQLKDEGYKIALDDFGSENASFSRMLDLKIDILKIDAMFIKNIDTDKNSRLIVEGIVYMAKLFNYDVVAEYVHSKEVLEVLKSLGIKYSQGYYFNPPLEKPLIENN